MLRIPFADLAQALTNTLIPLGFTPDRAALCARLFTETTCDGVYTHGVNRFPRFLATIANGVVVPSASPTLTSAFGAIERWHGNQGPGNLNAHASMARAITLARTHGIGCVALSYTNHWMRGGSYGWQAADQGFFAISFTNTLPNLPVWGSSAPTLGNNPLVLAIPRPEGKNIVLDMAMSQYSYGTLTSYANRGTQLPYPGGFGPDGTLTTDPAAIEQTGRALPVGLWKGSGLSLTLDLIAAMLSGGKSTHEIEKDSLKETSVSQLFLAIDPTHITDPEALAATATSAIADLHSATPIDPARPPRYPGEETIRLREENLRLGIPVEEAIWQSLNHSPSPA